MYNGNGMCSPTHWGIRNVIHTLFRPTWKSNFKSEIWAFLMLVFIILAVFPLYRHIGTDQISDLKFDFQVGRNKVWIGFLIPRWVREHILSSIYTDILRYLGSGGYFCSHSTSGIFLQYSFSNPPDRQKYTDFVPTLEPTTARYTRTFSTIWVSIDFYFFRRKQRK